MDITNIESTLLSVVPNVIAAVLILVAFWILYRFSKGVIARALTKAGIDKALSNIIISNVYRIILIIIAIVMAASQVGINVTAALTGLGVIGIALGFAAQESLSNIIAGFIILLDKPFVVGHWIEVNDEYGKVVEITLRTTRIRKRDNTYVVLPNQEVINQTIINHSKSGPVRVQVEVGIAYKEQARKAREVILKNITGVEGVLHEPAPDVVVDSLGDSSINLLVRFWITGPKEDEPMRFKVLELVKESLDEADIEIPFPHLQLFVDEVKQKAVDSLKKLS